MFKESILLN